MIRIDAERYSVCTLAEGFLAAVVLALVWAEVYFAVGGLLAGATTFVVTMTNNDYEHRLEATRVASHLKRMGRLQDDETLDSGGQPSGVDGDVGRPDDGDTASTSSLRHRARKAADRLAALGYSAHEFTNENETERNG